MSEREKVTITRERYEELLEKETRLRAILRKQEKAAPETVPDVEI